MTRNPNLILRLGTTALLLCLASPLSAETSSWSARETSVPKSSPAPSASPLPPPRAPSPAAAQDSGATGIKKAIPSLVPATGDNAAYLAFDVHIEFERDIVVEGHAFASHCASMDLK